MRHTTYFSSNFYASVVEDDQVSFSDAPEIPFQQQRAEGSAGCGQDPAHHRRGRDPHHPAKASTPDAASLGSAPVGSEDH